jgi:hemerythrin-like domain-containing protein
MQAAARPGALQIIRDEHFTLAAVLRAMLQLLRRGPGDRPEQFFDMLRAMLFYIDEFPEKRHHPKESRLLFPHLARKAPELAPVIRALEQDHRLGHDRVRELQHLLLAWELLGDGRRAEFEDAATTYTEFYVRHMQTEEAQLLPVAERCLDGAEMEQLDAAFQENRDLFGADAPDGAYDRLFARIVMNAPAPVGAGPAER